MKKFIPRDRVGVVVQELKNKNRRVVFTNGCFDILHGGHVDFLYRAGKLGDVLLVAVNSDDSVRRLKGPERPIQPELERVEILCALESVQLVTIFSEDTPAEIIRHVVPNILVKGGDWSLDQIVGRETVEAAGGSVFSLPLVDGLSTSGLVNRVKENGSPTALLEDCQLSALGRE